MSNKIQIRQFLTDRNLAATTAIATALLALGTAWLAWTTHDLAKVAYSEITLQRTVQLVRECGPASRNDAKSGDALIELDSRSSDGFEYNDWLSRVDLLDRFKCDKIDYLRCQFTNVSRLPLLYVHVSVVVRYANKGVVTIFFPLRTSQASSGGLDPTRIVWFANNGPLSATVRNPDKSQYTQLVPDIKNDAVHKLMPDLMDRWIVARDADIKEYLDQKEMNGF